LVVFELAHLPCGFSALPSSVETGPCIILPLFERPRLVSIFLAVLWLIHISFPKNKHYHLINIKTTLGIKV
jgi:hypothetical protein